MEFLSPKGFVRIAIPLLVSLFGCFGGGDLTSVASSLVETQRRANLTRTTMDGTWKGFLRSTGAESAEKTIYLVFSQAEGGTLDQSLLIMENIELDGTASRDTFEVRNGIFDNNRLRFNISLSTLGPLVAENSHPVMFEGELSENSFISGDFSAGTRIIATWETVLFQAAPQITP